MIYLGMSRSGGTAIDGLDHIRQSIADILTTPIGSRVERRAYGSLLSDLIDQPAEAANMMRMVSVIVIALMRWEPRIKVSRCSIELGEKPGQMIINLEAERTDGPYAGQSDNLSVIIGGQS